MMDILSVYASLSEFAIKRQGNIRLNVLASVLKILNQAFHTYIFSVVHSEMSNYQCLINFLRASSRVEAVASAKRFVRQPKPEPVLNELPLHNRWFHQTFRAMVDLSCID